MLIYSYFFKTHSICIKKLLRGIYLTLLFFFFLGIIVISDGVLSFPNCKSLDALLTQLRNSTIACSFIQLGSPFHPFSSFGRVPYKELMEFISTATCGDYFPATRDIVCSTKIFFPLHIYLK